jgi:hypothetical protein
MDQAVEKLEILPGDYIAGFVDGEGCFSLNFRRDVRHERGKRTGIIPVYFYWDILFAIVLRGDDRDVLEKIKNTLGCETVTGPNTKGQVRFQVTNIYDLSDKILPFFERYQLHAKKRYDFDLWKEAVCLVKNNQKIKINRLPGKRGFQKVPWNPIDLKRLEEIRIEMKKFKSLREDWKWKQSENI